MKLYEGYLTEEKLGKVLNKILPDGEWIRNKTVPGASRHYRPDFRSEKYRLIVEYNGHLHYTVAKTVIDDYEKITELENLGYRVVWIPYWLQLNNDMIIEVMFPEIEDIEETLGDVEHTEFPNGFISEKCILPADFCSVGLHRFSHELKDFHPFVNEIMESLEKKVEQLGDVLVHPLGIECVCGYLAYKDR